MIQRRCKSDWVVTREKTKATYIVQPVIIRIYVHSCPFQFFPSLVESCISIFEGLTNLYKQHYRRDHSSLWTGCQVESIERSVAELFMNTDRLADNLVTNAGAFSGHLGDKTQIPSTDTTPIPRTK